MKKEFYLVRHAESLGNIGFKTGYDPGLSPLGRAQAHECAEFLRSRCDENTLFLSSPFKRCIKTAEPIAKAFSTGIQLEPALHELLLPEWYPLKKITFPSLNEIASQYPAVTGNYDDETWLPDKNERREDLVLRISLLRNRLMGRKFNKSKIIAVGHWASIAALIEAFCPGEIDIMNNACVSKIDSDGIKCKLDFLNESSFQEKTSIGLKPVS